MITKLRYSLGCWGHLISVCFREEVVIFGAILILVKNSAIFLLQAYLLIGRVEGADPFGGHS